MRRFAITIFVLILAPVAGAEELLQNPDFTDTVDPWLLWWGDAVTHHPGEGHLTAGGAAQVEGHIGSFAGVGQICIDVSGLPAGGRFHLAASIRPADLAVDPVSGIFVDYYLESDCTTPFDSRQILASTPAGAWSRVGEFFSPPPGTQGLAVIVASLGTPDEGITLFDDARLTFSPLSPDELLDNRTFTGSVDPWQLWWGDSFTHTAADGHQTPGGAAQVVGHVDTFAGIGQRCFDLSGRPPGTELFAASSMKADAAAPATPISGIVVFYYSQSNCVDEIDMRQILAFTPPGAWARLGDTFSPPPGARSFQVVLLVYGTPDGGVTRFDDATVTATAPLFFDGFESGDVSVWD